MTDMDFLQDGVAIVPIFSTKETEHYRHAFQNIQFPEFVIQDDARVMGGFGAYGNPASFHNEVVREMRQKAYPLMKTFFQKNFPKGFYLEQLFDRMCVRRKGTSTSRESWHRDVSPMIKDKTKDMVFGGWINLDDGPQYFSCALGTHMDELDTSSGFVRQTHPEQPSTRVVIPSGHAILFYQHILHQVLPQKQKKDSFRLFQSFRVVCSETEPFPLHGRETLETWIQDQATPLLPSGQHPPLYSSNHTSIFLFSGGPNDPILFSQKFHPPCLSNQVCKSGKHKGRHYTIVHRFMTSLANYHLPLYPSYSPQEKNIFFPQKL